MASEKKPVRYDDRKKKPETEPMRVAEPRAVYGSARMQPPERVLLAAAIVRRYSELLRRIGERAPERALEDALAASDDVGGLAKLLAEVSPLDPPPPDPLAAARARGALGKMELLRRAGGGLRAGEVAERMGVSPQAVHARRKRGTLLAVPQANGEHLYPACQFGPDGALPGLAAVLSAFAVESPWTRLSVLLAEADALGGRTPLEALAAGDVAGAAEAVSTYGEHGG